MAPCVTGRGCTDDHYVSGGEQLTDDKSGGNSGGKTMALSRIPLIVGFSAMLCISGGGLLAYGLLFVLWAGKSVAVVYLWKMAIQRDVELQSEGVHLTLVEFVISKSSQELF